MNTYLNDEQIEEVLKEILFNQGSYPQKSLSLLLEHPQQMAPHLLNVLEMAHQHAEELIEKPEYIGHLLSMIILAYYRETEAFSRLLNVFSLDDEILYPLYGDFQTELFPMALYRCFSGEKGQWEELVDFVNNENHGLYARAGAYEVMVLLALDKRIDRELVNQFFAEVLSGENPLHCAIEEERLTLLAMLIDSTALLQEKKFLPDIEKLYAEDLVDTSYVHFIEIEEIMHASPEKVFADAFHRFCYYNLDEPLESIKNWNLYENQQRESGLGFREQGSFKSQNAPKNTKKAKRSKKKKPGPKGRKQKGKKAKKKR
jgi:hypothetical protein